ncbi:MAG: response regulator transcription factor [Cellulosilyticum sp.]|nr:response regulator transcription factor [Cellulosilyticum sp.]
MNGFIERLEEEFHQHHQSDYLIVQVLLILQGQGLTSCISLDYISEMLRITRFTGMRTQLQEFLIFLAEQNEAVGRSEEAISCLKEALEIKKDTGIVVNFYLHSRKTAYHLKELDVILYEKVRKWHKEEKTQEYILTSKEREILTLVAEGKSNAEIGEILYITVGTVKWHMNHILSKLGVKNRTQAIVEARQLGEIT